MRIKYKKMNNLWAVLLLSIVLISISLATILRVEKIIEQKSFQTLNDTVKQGAINIRSMLESEERRMTTAVDILGGFPVLSEEVCSEYLEHLNTGGLISSYSVLLPDNRMVYAADTAVRVDTVPGFSVESQKPAHFISRCEEISGDKYAAYVSKIVRDDIPVGVLYGYVRLSDLPKEFEFSAFNGQCQLYLVDGSTGDFLMDTWHDTLGNMYDESLAIRKMKLGTSFEQMREDVVNEKAGYVVFESTTAGEDFYSCYYPVDKYHLSFQLTVPRSVAFAEAVRIQKIVTALGGVQLTAVLAYALSLLRKARHRSREDGQELELNRALNEVQRNLFSVYKKPYMIDVSLERLKCAIDAEQIVLLLLNEGIIEKFFALPAADKQDEEHVIGERLPEIMLQDIRAHLEKKGLTMNANDDREKLQRIREMPGLLMPEEVRNCACIWTLDSDQEIIGLMYAVNVENPEKSREALSAVVSSFLLAIQTMDAYNRLYRMGEIDAMTGLKNRNAYQKSLENKAEHSDACSCCIYVDANGLHDMNNNFGHASGDQMLNCIGSMLRELFGTEDSYRIGGDEFVVFCTGLDENTVLERIELLKSRLEKLEYYISVGFAFREEGQRVQQLVANAEARMYESKKKFYIGSRDRRKNRQHNQKLENLLIEKKDQENFLFTISANYLGVYAVNLDTNKIGSIFKSSYLNEILEEMDYCYQNSIHEYAKKFISGEDYEDFINFVDYRNIEEKIYAGHVLEYCYRKKNNDAVRLRVLPTSSYSKTQKDTLWIFEKYSLVES